MDLNKKASMVNIRKAIKKYVHPNIDIIYNPEGERGPYYYFSYDSKDFNNFEDIPPQLIGAYRDGVYFIKREEYTLKKWVALAAAWHRDCYENYYLSVMKDLTGEEIEIGLENQE